MNRPEQSLQQQAVRFIELAAPDLYFWHTPNALGRSSKTQGAIRKSLGVKAGVPDLAFILPLGKIAFIELKVGKGKLTESQAAFRDHCAAKDIPWAEARSLEDIQAILHGWLSPFGWTLKARAA